MTPSRDEVLAALSREVAFVCDPRGQILWADERAARVFGPLDGASLPALALEQSREKVRQLLAAIGAGKAGQLEVSLLCKDRPRTFAFSGRPTAEGLALVGSLVPEDFGQALSQVNETMNELANLNRETNRQKLELQLKQEELTRVNRELSDSNRGMLNLYAELDEKADSLRRSGEVKSRVVANVSHEFRTPLNSILGLARLLLTRTDGPLTQEQEKQLGFILKSADELSLMVNDILDLSKIEAGKTRLSANTFEAGELFGALRGMLRPLEKSEHVELVFDDVPAGLPVMNTDEGKVSQILRNLVSNALKFTERGEVRVSVAAIASDRVSFAVRDTGVGIARGDHERIFEEFTQLDTPMSRRVKGTGLGLSLSRKLAELLGGTLTVESEEGKGSTFRLVIPAMHPEVTEMERLVGQSEQLDPAKAPVLVVEDDRQTLFLYEKYLQGSGFQVVPARSIEEARAMLRRVRPCAVVLDIMLEGESTWQFLTELKENEETSDIPTLVVTVTDREQKARALGADEFFLKPMDQTWLLRKLRTLAKVAPVEKVLVIDDDEISRYLIKRMLADSPYGVIEASGGLEGVKLARSEEPQVILLDFVLPEVSAFEVLDELKADPRTRKIPVIIHTAKSLDETERQRLQEETAAILNKQSLSREVAIARIRDALSQALAGAKERNHG